MKNMYDDFQVSVNAYLPLRDVVFNTLREAILTGKLAPGERLMEKQLSEKIGVSRTPIREALRRLELEGLVIMTPRKGAHVSAINEKDIRNVLEVRACLEALAARLACRNRTERTMDALGAAKDAFMASTNGPDITLMAEKDELFHDLIAQSTGNDKLIQIINNLREQVYRYRIEYLKDKNERLSIIRDHEELYQALLNRDEKKADAAATKHIVNQEQVVIASIKNQKEKN